MTKAKISQYDASADGNTDVNGVNIAEGCAPSGINNAIREVMAAVKRFETGSDGDSVTVGGNFVVVGSTTANTIAATVVNASGNATVGGTLVVTGATTFSGNVVISGSTTATTVSTTVVQSDTISEKTSAAGVTVDGVLLKDTTVTANTIKASGTSSSQGEVQFFEDTDNGTNYVAFKAPASIASDVTWTLPGADGTANQVLSTDGSGTLSWATAAGGGAANVQTFDTSGTWTKPASGSMAHVQMWGGGGGGARNTTTGVASGGGGGGYQEFVVPLSYLDSSVSVTVAAGGAGRTGSTGNGTAGGNTSVPFANWPGGSKTLSAFGGGPGSTSYQGGGGGIISAGVTGTCGSEGFGNGWFYLWGGGKGSNDGSTNFGPYLMAYGGNGGAGAGGTSNFTGGTPVFGGKGGDGGRVTSGFDGTTPAGGGGGRNNNLNGGNGAAGRVIITVW